MERKRKNFKLFTVLFLIFYIVGNNSFGAKTSDYVNKIDVENAKKIFIYKVPKKVQTEIIKIQIKIKIQQMYQKIMKVQVTTIKIKYRIRFSLLRKRKELEKLIWNTEM